MSESARCSTYVRSVRRDPGQDRHDRANVARADSRSVLVHGVDEEKDTHTKTAWVSLRRVEKFLNEVRSYPVRNISSLMIPQTEVLDSFAASAPPPPAPPPEHAGKIGLAHATFTWSARDAGLGVAGRFQLRIDDVLEFRRGALNLVLGPTGGGKSALILALLGELHYVPHGPDSWCSLPREGGIALAAQETWVMSDTIRNNVVFGADWDEARYRKGERGAASDGCGLITRALQYCTNARSSRTSGCSKPATRRRLARKV
jgi:ABC-type multidrug transport system fused ATPase/permease subunit